MFPGQYDLELYRGDTARYRFVLWQDEAKTLPIDLTGVTVTAQIRDQPNSGTIRLQLTCATTLPNTIEVTVPSDGAANLHQRGAWDLQLTWPGGDVQTILH